MISRKLRLISAGMIVLALAPLAPAQDQKRAASPKEEPKKESQTAPVPDYNFTGPFTHANLTVFLIHGKNTLPGKSYLTLQEALDQKKVIVHETQRVNELSVENTATDVEVFIQAGDIVKGGKQDRVFAYDLVVPAHSGKMPLASFCVEAGRWQKRGSEDATRFGSSRGQVSGKDLKLAVNYARKQDQVWAKVREAQMKLSKNVGKPVANQSSPSSLQLTLEDKQLLESLDKYMKDLAKITDGQTDVIGYAVAINGQVEGADVYGAAALFQKLWPKLLNSCAVDALAEFDKDKKFNPATVDDVKDFLVKAADGKKTEKEVSKRVNVVTKDSKKYICIEACDREQKGSVIHRSVISK
jgi:hypothetical protein